ncbi:MAG TPA: hypothetical protein VGI95_19875 [Caulobacteraceae bacterium]|jgi:hypothetical protein
MGPGAFFGGLLIVVGALIAGLCGLCTFTVMYVSVMSPPGSGSTAYGGGAMIPLALLFGGIPTVIGGLIVWLGIFLIRQSRKPPTPPAS